jgi:hypothetical protein
MANANILLQKDDQDVKNAAILNLLSLQDLTATVGLECNALVGSGCGTQQTACCTGPTYVCFLYPSTSESALLSYLFRPVLVVLSPLVASLSKLVFKVPSRIHVPMWPNGRDRSCFPK